MESLRASVYPKCTENPQNSKNFGNFLMTVSPPPGQVRPLPALFLSASPGGSLGKIWANLGILEGLSLPASLSLYI